MSPYQMQFKHKTRPLSESRSQAEGLKNVAGPAAILADVKERLREQICEHPGEALKISLITGIIAGWWVKR